MMNLVERERESQKRVYTSYREVQWRVCERVIPPDSLLDSVKSANGRAFPSFSDSMRTILSQTSEG